MIGQFSHDGIGWKTRVKFAEIDTVVSCVIICNVLLSEYVINKQFHEPKHQDRLTEIQDTRKYILFVFLASDLLLFARLVRFQGSKHFREQSALPDILDTRTF